MSRGSVGGLHGRGEELRQLGEAIERAAGGAGGVAFLAGDQGVGKTALVRAVTALARQRGFAVLAGRSWPLDAPLAYAPVIDALGPALRALEPRGLHEVADELPDLGRLFPWLPQAPVPLGDPALEKTRLFEAVARLLERLAGDAPLLLC